MKIIKQDMLAVPRGVLFHQVNCQGIMGGGIAFALAKKFPGLEPAYQHFCEQVNDPQELLGKVHIWSATNDICIANVFGQNSISRTTRQTSYDATVNAFERIAKARGYSPSSVFNDLPLFFPFKMGCGLGGGDWEIYSTILNRYFPDGTICQHE